MIPVSYTHLDVYKRQVGEWATTTLAVGADHQLDILKEIRFPHSLGLLYSAMTYYTGFKVNSGEYMKRGAINAA